MDIGIDLGTANTLISTKNNKVIINEPTIVAIDKKTNKIIAVGKEANDMLGRNPNNIKIVKPLRDGVIADLEITEIFLKELLSKINNQNIFLKPRILINYPSNISPIEKETFKELGERLGARKVYLKNSTLSASYGIGLDISKPSANMIIDIGGGITEISILSLNNIVISDSIKVAGNSFNNSIIKYIKETHKLLIGEKTAEQLKNELVDLEKPNIKNKKEISGRDLLSGLPKTMEINQTELISALEKDIKKIIAKISNMLEVTPPELAADIINKGIILIGGSSKLKGLRHVIEENIKITTFIISSPETCIVEGNIKLLSNKDL